MKKRVLICLFADLFFALILIFSSAFSGAVKEIVYYAAFILPFLFACFLSSSLSLDTKAPKISLSRENLKLVLPLVMPSLFLIFAVSYITTLILSPFGIENPAPDVSGNLFSMIILHALLPSVLEEMLFRYIPQKLFWGKSTLFAAVLSSLLFAVAHGNPYQIPYAFQAGIVFYFANVISDSILPSVIMHFLNNLLSVFWLRYSHIRGFAIAYTVFLSVTFLISLLPIVIRRKSYGKKLTAIKNKD